MELNPIRYWVEFRTSLIEQFARTQGVKFKPTVDETIFPSLAPVVLLEKNVFQGGSTPAADAEEKQGDKYLVEHAGFNGPGDKLPDANHKELCDSLRDPSNAINICKSSDRGY